MHLGVLAMALNKYKLGELIELCEDKNSDGNYTLEDVRGISIQKCFIYTKADMQGVSLTPYLLVKPDCFAYVTVTSRNGEKITLAHNTTARTYIVSSSYVVFKVKEPNLLLSDYLFMYFNRSEFDRYSRFNSWGSARETFDWDTMCDIDIELPDIKVQQKYVDIYNAMLANQKAYERGLEDLKLVCDGYIEDLRRKIPSEEIGAYIQQEIIKNEKKEIVLNKAVSIEKIFVDSHADLLGVDISNYLIVEKCMFAYNTVTTRNSDKLSIALNKDAACLVSPIYTVFSVDEKKIVPEYLMLWFKRSEFDRYTRYNSWGSAREMFPFEEMRKVNIPLPNIDKQKSIAEIYNLFMNRTKINEKLKKQLKDICPILIRGSLEEN